MDRGAWRATVHGVTKSQTPLKQLSTHKGSHNTGQLSKGKRASSQLGEGCSSHSSPSRLGVNNVYHWKDICEGPEVQAHQNTETES